MTYRGTLPPGQAAFPGQQDQLYGAQQAGYHHPQQQQQQQPPPQHQQQQHHHHHHHAQQQQGPAQDHMQQHQQSQLLPPPPALYDHGGGGGGHEQFYGRQPAQHQHGQFRSPSQYHMPRPQLDDPHQQQQQQQQQQHMAHYGMGMDAFSNFDAGARFAPVQQPPQPHYSTAMQSPVMPFHQQGRPVATSPYNVPATTAMSPPAVQRPPPMRPMQVLQQQQQQQQQQMYQSPRSSPQVHHQPSPQVHHQPSPQVLHQPSPQSRPSSTHPPLQQPQPLPPRPLPQSQPQQQQHQQPSPQPQHRPPAQQQQQPLPQPPRRPSLSEPRPFAPESHRPAPEPQLPTTQEPPPPAQQEIHFVNPQDILQAPRPPPPIAMGAVHSSGSRAPDPAPPASVAHARSQSMSIPVKSSPTQAHPSLGHGFKRAEPKPEPSRLKSSPHSSVTNSPALSARSPSITKKSPAIPPKPRPVNTGPIMVAIAEECLEKARSAVHDVVMSLHPERVDEYQKLIATSLSCLEATLQNCRLSPREEARVRLRYAATLQEETENLMEAEMALGKGITLCDKHRLVDLKYCMQYLMLKVLFQRSHKAALKAVDGHISDCETFKHVQWYYAFRLLKSTFYMEMGNASDAGALENIRSVQHIANTRGDNALSVLASILEGLSLLKTPKDGSIERVQACIAQAAKFQFDPTVKIMQLDVLALLLDFASSLHHQSPDNTSQKLRLLQMRLDECDEWHNVRAEFLVPIKKQPSNARTVSDDTAMIVRAGQADSAFDYLVMSFMTKIELRALVFTFSGLANLHKPSAQGRRSTEFWREGVKILDSWDSSTANIPYGPAVSLATAVRQRTWRVETQAYLNVLLGLMAASHCQWETVKHLLSKLRTTITPATQPAVKLLSVYLTGVYHQGTGNLQAALHIFTDRCFAFPQGSAGVRAGQREIALLAGLNRLWIMQHPSCRRDQETQDLIEQLQPHCTDHWNIDLRTAWHNVVAALETEPPQQLNQQKQHIHAAMAGSKTTNNILGAAVTLCIMRSRFFENVIGEQALKSARAASKQAQRSGNILWQSVADGMLAQSYEVQGQRDESRHEWDKATKEAKDAFAGSW